MTETRRSARAGRAARENRPPSAIGRPSLLYDEALVKLIVRDIRVGVHGEVAARANGISKPTFYRWLQEAGHADLKVQEGLTITEYERRTREFRDEVDKAEAFAERRMVAEARRQAATQATAQGSVALLERRFPARWKFTQVTELTGKDGGPIEIAELTDEELETRLRKLADIAQEVTR